MKLYLAGLEASLHYDKFYKYIKNINKNNIYILFSYYYITLRKSSRSIDIILKNKDNILIDSGAFTFIQGGLNVDIEQYTDGYIDFINKYNIKYFFEMDVDSVLGYDKVKILRKKIEDGTGKKVIPVWHVNRGIEEFKKHCEEYDYVAIGGLVGCDKQLLNIVKEMIKYANSKKVKIHLLGYSKSDIIDLDAYSYDSSSWNGYIYGNIYIYDNNIKRPIINRRKKNKRLDNNKLEDIIIHNFKVWKHYSNYIKYVKR